MEIDYCSGPVAIPATHFPALLGALTVLAQRHWLVIPPWTVLPSDLSDPSEETQEEASVSPGAAAAMGVRDEAARAGMREERLALRATPEARRQRLEVVFEALQWTVRFVWQDAWQDTGEPSADDGAVRYLTYEPDDPYEWPPFCDDVITLIGRYATSGHIERRTDEDRDARVWLMDGVGGVVAFDAARLYGNWSEVVRALLLVVREPSSPAAVEGACRRALQLLAANSLQP